MNLTDVLEYNGLSLDLLEEFSYESKLGMSLKRTLRHFDKTALFAEISDYANFLDEINIADKVSLDFRIKCSKSVRTKYDRYYPDRETNKVFNDILGFRAFCDSYYALISYGGSIFEVADMSHGKSNDDGYRGVHVYYKKSNRHYPIEIQFNTLFDRQLNNWLHDFVYKKGYPPGLGKYLREKYEEGCIRNEYEFREVMKNGLSGC